MMTSMGKNMWAEISADIPRGASAERRNEKVPCYSLTKTECLYVATKFNDEVRAQKFSTSSRDFWRRLSKMETSSLLRSTCAKVHIFTFTFSHFTTFQS